MNKKNEGNLFTTKRYVSIQTLPIQKYVSIKTLILHLQEIYVNQNTTSSSPRNYMFPLGIETI
jgi:hypothetical protein